MKLHKFASLLVCFRNILLSYLYIYAVKLFVFLWLKIQLQFILKLVVVNILISHNLSVVQSSCFVIKSTEHSSDGPVWLK